MTLVNVSIPMDENLKQQFERLCYELGLSVEAACTIFAKTMVRQQRIPFEVSMNPCCGETEETA